MSELDAYFKRARNNKHLKPCPFCGSKDIRHSAAERIIFCMDCDAEMFSQSRESSIVKWNKRYND